MRKTIRVTTIIHIFANNLYAHIPPSEDRASFQRSPSQMFSPSNHSLNTHMPGSNEELN